MKYPPIEKWEKKIHMYVFHTTILLIVETNSNKFCLSDSEGEDENLGENR